MNDLYQLSKIPAWILFTIFSWSIIWKGLALWRAAKLEQRNWFVGLLVLSIINTIGILDIAYLFFFAKKRLKIKELMFWQK